LSAGSLIAANLVPPTTASPPSVGMVLMSFRRIQPVHSPMMRRPKW
jgi:hypothetical protein